MVMTGSQLPCTVCPFHTNRNTYQCFDIQPRVNHGSRQISCIAPPDRVSIEHLFAMAWNPCVLRFNLATMYGAGKNNDYEIDGLRGNQLRRITLDLIIDTAPHTNVLPKCNCIAVEDGVVLNLRETWRITNPPCSLRTNISIHIVSTQADKNMLDVQKM